MKYLALLGKLGTPTPTDISKPKCTLINFTCGN